MKICYIASLGSVHTERWMRYFADRGHEVHLITSGKLSNAGVENVRLHGLKKFGPNKRIVSYVLNSLPKLIQFKKLIRDINPDVIHAQQIMEITLLSIIIKFHPFIVTPWGSDVLIGPKKSRISKWIVKYVMKKADLISCDAEHIQKPLIELGADARKMRLIYFGTDIRKFNPSQSDGKIRDELGISDSPMIISLRHLEPIYDIDSLITAIPLVVERFSEAKFVIVGRGSQEERLKGLAKTLGVWDSIRFVRYIPDNELPKYIASSDIYISTSLSDAGLAASTAEAMACGVPAIITDFGDNKKWVIDGVNGLTFPPKDSQALASKIICLLENEDKRKKFGELSREMIEEKNNWEIEMSKMEKLYEELVEKFSG